MFLTYVIKADKREVPRLYFKYIYVLLLFLVFPENYPYVVKVDNFGSYSIPPPNQANLMFLTYVIKVDKREVLRLYFKHINVLLLFSVFPYI